MKLLLAGIVFIIVIGVIGFFYKNAVEKSGEPKPAACTMEAKLCPDGSSVGRSGPNCEFSACPTADVQIGRFTFALPPGYTRNDDALGTDPTLLAVLEKPSPSKDVSHAIVYRSYPIPAGKTEEDVMIDKTIFEPSDMGATSMDQFQKITIGKYPYYFATIERFEGQVHSVYYIFTPYDIIDRFEVLERDVANWSDPSLNVRELPEHKALEQMLTTLEVPN